MQKSRERKPISEWNGVEIAAGEARNVNLAVSESYSSMTVRIPIHIRRAAKDGPVVFVTAALHGDEINGTGAVRQLIQDEQLQLLRGALILVPVLNLLAFDRHRLNSTSLGVGSGAAATAWWPATGVRPC